MTHPRATLAVLFLAWGAIVGFSQTSPDELRAYFEGKNELDAGRWEAALKTLEAAPRSEGAIYWRAFAMHRLERNPEALEMLNAFRAAHPESRWLNDGAALTAEIQGTEHSLAEADVTKWMYSSLVKALDSDPAATEAQCRAVLAGPYMPATKTRLLTILLGKGGEPARTILLDAVRGGMNPDLQEFAIGGFGRTAPDAVAEAYWSITDAHAKGMVLTTLASSRDRTRLAQIAERETAADLRERALTNLVTLGAGDTVMKLLEKEPSESLKRSMASQLVRTRRTVERSLSTLTSSREPKARREAVQGLLSGTDDSVDSMLTSIYPGEKDATVKEAIILVLSAHRSYASLSALGRTETNVSLKEQISRSLAARAN